MFSGNKRIETLSRQLLWHETIRDWVASESRDVLRRGTLNLPELDPDNWRQKLQEAQKNKRCSRTLNVQDVINASGCQYGVCRPSDMSLVRLHEFSAAAGDATESCLQI